MFRPFKWHCKIGAIPCTEDVWILDVSNGSWQQSAQHNVGPVLWHAAAVAYPGELTVYGGIKNNLLDPSQPKVGVFMNSLHVCLLVTEIAWHVPLLNFGPTLSLKCMIYSY